MDDRYEHVGHCGNKVNEFIKPVPPKSETNRPFPKKGGIRRKRPLILQKQKNILDRLLSETNEKGVLWKYKPPPSPQKVEKKRPSEVVQPRQKNEKRDELEETIDARQSDELPKIDQFALKEPKEESYDPTLNPPKFFRATCLDGRMSLNRPIQKKKVHPYGWNEKKSEILDAEHLLPNPISILSVDRFYEAAIKKAKVSDSTILISWAHDRTDERSLSYVIELRTTDDKWVAVYTGTRSTCIVRNQPSVKTNRDLICIRAKTVDFVNKQASAYSEPITCSLKTPKSPSNIHDRYRKLPLKVRDSPRISSGMSVYDQERHHKRKIFSKIRDSKKQNRRPPLRGGSGGLLVEI